MRPRTLALVALVGACSSPAVVTTTPASTSSTTTSTTLAASDVFRSVSPTLAFVETPLASGSAVLVDATTLVTNAHVVWPGTEAEISFPGGASGQAPVVGYDWMADLALIDVSGLRDLPGPAVFHAEPVDPGAPVYLVGYPADDPDSAAPAITSGIVSRLRRWEEGNMTFIQSDALISGGQSGGALVDHLGRVVGISGLSVGEGFALALTSRDVLDRVAGIRSGADGPLAHRAVADLLGDARSSGTTPFALDETVFVFDGADGDVVSIEIQASQAINADLVGPDGFVEASSRDAGVRLSLEADLVLDGPYFVVVHPELDAVDAFEITGATLREWRDPDHGVALTVGGSVSANGDYPGDLDWFSLTLIEGQTVTIRATSINIDPAIFVDLLVPGDGGAFARDSDTGGGVLGFDAELEYTAPESGTYAVAVFDETGFGPGGYVVTVEE